MAPTTDSLADTAYACETRGAKVYKFGFDLADTRSPHAWRPGKGEINMIDAYTVHRGTEAVERVFHTWIRLSFEVRQFDRSGNAHNPLFQYDWTMRPRDIEGLNLVAFNETGDPSLRVFPWQNVHGTAHIDPKKRTKPQLY